MSTPSTKLQRWLDLVAYLAGRRLPVSTEYLWRAVPAYEAGLDGNDKNKQTVRRMFERDKDELRKLGIPIDTVTYSINYGLEQATGYRLATKDFHLPYMKLMAEARERGADAARGTADAAASPISPTSPDASSASTSDFPITPDEASAALGGLSELSGVPAFPLRSAARSAFRKLAFDLEPNFLRETPVVYAEDPETAATRDVLRLLSGAVQRRKAVCFRYRGMTRDTEEERHVHPFGLLFQHGRWYMVGRDLDRGAERMFRLGRISDAREQAPKKGASDYEVPEEFDLETYAGRSAWEVGEDPEGSIEVVVRFAFPRSLWAERNGHGALVEEHADGSQLRRFRILRRDPFLRWVLSLAGDARVERPGSLRDEFTALVREVARRHGPDPTEET
ncbi:MAG: WYL domain-containing protein [Gemmatimonadota bacterium]